MGHTIGELANSSGTAMDILLNDPTEYSARAVLWHAANYLYATQGERGMIYSHGRIQAMDLMDDIRRDWANWQDLSKAYGVEYRDYPVLRQREVKNG